MNHSDVLKVFFSQSFEKQLNNMILEDIDYDIDKYGLLNYVANVIAVPYSEYLKYIAEHVNDTKIESRHITQSSSFEACEREMINIFLYEDNRGLDFVEIGRHFTKYIRSDKDGAFRKYGENQVKTAEQLGLSYEYYNHWYLNCIGYIYNELPIEDQHSLLARNLLRDPLYSKMMLDILEKDIDLLSYMDCIPSNETKLRRYDSVKRLLIQCLAECLKEGISTNSILDKKSTINVSKRKAKTDSKIEPYETKLNIGYNSKPYIFNEEEMPDRAVADSSDISCNILLDKCNYYKKQFMSLRCFSKKGKPAPYKALMLLSVIELIEKRIIKDNCITASDELRVEYKYQSSIRHYDKALFNPPFETPFIHLSGEAFWHINIVGGLSSNIVTLSQVSQIESVTLDDDLYKLLLNDETRFQLRQVLIDKYLSDK